MAVEQVETGPSPHVVVTCGGDADVRGCARTGVRVESGGSPRRITPVEGGVEIKCADDCTVEMPAEGSLVVRQVGGDLRVRELAGEVVVEGVGGSCHVRHVGTLRASNVGDEARVRVVGGAVSLHRVGGSAAVFDIAGPVEIHGVGGDLLVRNAPGGLDARDIGGSVAIRSDFRAGADSHVEAGGDVTFRVPSSAGIRFVLPAGADLSLGAELEVLVEKDGPVVRLGDGETAVVIARADSVTIRQGIEVDEEAAFDYTFTTGQVISEQLADLSRELESQFATLEATLSETISEQVRRRIARRLSSARRQVDAARRGVEQEVRRAQHGGSGAWPGEIAFGSGQKREVEPPTGQERLMILEMLEKGVIDVDEADELLAALGEEG
jgi:hypothetical protein